MHFLETDQIQSICPAIRPAHIVEFCALFGVVLLFGDGRPEIRPRSGGNYHRIGESEFGRSFGI